MFKAALPKADEPGPRAGAPSLATHYRQHLERAVTSIPLSACELVDAERCTFYLMDEERRMLRPASSTGLLTEEDFRGDFGLPGYAARSIDPIIIDRASCDPRVAELARRSIDGSIRTALYLQLRDSSGHVLGVLELLDKTSGSFGPRDVIQLEVLCRYAAASLEGMKLDLENRRVVAELTRTRAELVEQIRRMEVLRRIETAINESDDFEQVFPHVLELCAGALEAETGSAFLLEGDRPIIFLGPCKGETSDEVRRSSISLEEGISGWVLQNRKPTVSNDPQQDVRFSRRVREMMRGAVRNLAAAPLLGQRGVVGVVALLNRWGSGFGEADLGFLDFLGAQIGGALQKKLLSNEARSAQRLAAVGSVAARIVHDIKQPISVLKLIAYDLQHGDLDSERQQAHARLMQSSIDRLAEMTQDVLDFSRGEMTYNFDTLTLRELFEDVLPGLERDCEGHRIRLETAIAGEATLRADASRLKRVLLNITSNAIDAMPQGGVLTLKAEMCGGEAVFEVSDTGAGIPAEILERLFNPFVTHGKKHGTGLGLAICKTIVEAHRGRIEVRNNASVGACFRIAIPRFAADAPAPAEMAQTA